MRKLSAVLLAVIMLMSFTACENTPDNEAAGESASVSEKATSSETVREETDAGSSETVFEEVTVVDNEACVIKITDFTHDELWGYALKAELENKSPDTTYMFSLDKASVNGVELIPFFASEVSPGKKSNEDITLSDTTLEENGITDYTDIELTFRVYDSEDWEADDVTEETVHIYPYGEDKATLFTREASDTDIVLVDNEYVSAVITGFTDDEIWGYTAEMFIVNKTDCDIMLSTEDVSVNGYMADPFFATSVSAGKCAFSSMTWDDTTLEENGITEIETIEFTLTAYDENDWSADHFVNETVTVTP